jgi:sporulation-control protein
LVFRRLLRSVGVGGPSARTILDDVCCRPGGELTGRVLVVGGDHPVDIAGLTCALITRVEVPTGDSGYDTDQEFHRQRAGDRFRLDAGEQRELPFRVEVPWQAPVTIVYGRALLDITVGLRTELEVDVELNRCGVEPVTVQPLPAQEAVLATVAGLDFRFVRAGVERGRLYGVQQAAPFHQEFAFEPGPGYAETVEDLALAFLAGPERLEIVVEVGRRGGLLARERGTFGRFTVDGSGADLPERVAGFDEWLRRFLRD